MIATEPPTPTRLFSRWKSYLWLTAGSLIVFALAYFSPFNSADSDPYFSLLVSQAIIEHGTIRLDAYAAEVGDAFQDNYQLFELNDHIYYFYPVGPSIFAVPAVFLLNLAGHNMANVDGERFAQNLLSAVVCVLIWLLLVALARVYLPDGLAFIVATITMLGSTFISTFGTAYWNQASAVVFALLGLWLVARAEVGDKRPWLPYALGFVLFLAYLSRPTSSIFIAGVLLYLFVRQRPFFWRAAPVALVGLLAFMLHSWLHFDTLLPPYYLDQRFGGDNAAPLLVALTGILFSPGRGLFVYSPFFLVVVVGVLRFGRPLVQKHPIALLCLIWVGVHWALVSRFWNWWGGYSFGPRLLVDSMPALALLAILLLAYVQTQSLLARRAIWVSFVGLGVLAVVVNSYFGLFRPQMGLATGQQLSPRVDHAPEFLFSWAYTPFFITPDAACERNAIFMNRLLSQPQVSLEGYKPGTEITPDRFVSPAESTSPWRERQPELTPDAATVDELPYKIYLPVSYRSWSGLGLATGLQESDGGPVWAVCSEAEIWLGAASGFDLQETYILNVEASGLGTQRVLVGVNGIVVGEMVFDDRQLSQQRLEISGADLYPDRLNSLQLDFLDVSVSPQTDKVLPRIRLHRIWMDQQAP